MPSTPAHDSWRKSKASSSCGVDRAEHVREQSVVARALHGDADRAEPVAERGDALDEHRHAVEPRERELRREAEPVGHRVGPPLELILGRQPVAGRVQLDGVEARRVEAQELVRPRALRVEAGPPGGIRPARGADVNRPSGRQTRVRSPMSVETEQLTREHRSRSRPRFSRARRRACVRPRRRQRSPRLVQLARERDERDATRA